MVDPIDGSVNAKRGLWNFCLSIAVAEGTTMGDVVFGYVHDFGTGEEWTAEKGGGAQLDGRPLGAIRPKETVEILAMEGTLAASVADHAKALVGYAQRFRITGSLALSLCQLAAGRVDAVCSLREVRSVDTAAAQLLVREVGLRSGSRMRGRGTAHRSTRAPHGVLVAAPGPAGRGGPRLTPTARGSPGPCWHLLGRQAPRSGGERDPHRVLGVELPALARAGLSERASAEALARALRDALRHRRGQQHLLPAATDDGGARMGGAQVSRASSSR